MTRSGDSVQRGPVDESNTDSAQTDSWSRLKRAQRAEEFASIWLEIQSEAIKGVRCGVVVLGPKSRGPFAPVAVWPAGTSGSRPLAEVVEKAIKDRKSLARPGKAATADSSGLHHFVAAPVVVNDSVYGAVAIEIAADPEQDIGALISSLEWAATWIESFIRRQWTPPSDRQVPFQGWSDRPVALIRRQSVRPIMDSVAEW